MTLWRIAGLPLVLALAVGCQTAPQPKAEATEVQGTVTLDGKPAAVSIEFNPTTSALSTAMAKAGPDGKFTARIIPGKYNFQIAEGGDKEMAKQVPEKYKVNSPENAIEVAAGQPITIALTK